MDCVIQRETRIDLNSSIDWLLSGCVLSGDGKIMWSVAAEESA